jgi:hypothetical protein
MNIFRKLILSSKAKNGDLGSLMKAYGETGDSGKDYIHKLINRRGLSAALLAYFEDPNPPWRVITEFRLPILAKTGNADALQYLVREGFIFDDLPEYKDTILIIYQKFASPELRALLIALMKEKLSKVKPYWSGNKWEKAFIQVVDELQGWDYSDCDTLIPLIGTQASVVFAILTRFNPHVVENLIPWLKYKDDKTESKKITMEPEFDALNDTWLPARTAYEAADYPTARCVADLLYKLTGKEYIYTK